MSNLATKEDPEWEFTEETQFLFESHRYKIGVGGRGGVKSWSFARALLIQGYEQPLRMLCAREVQRSIKESVHQLLSDQIIRLGLEGFYEILQSEIRGINGSKFLFTGLSNLTSESIKSYEGMDRCWIEEAANVTRRSWDILIPTIRKEGSEIWATFNPELDTDETWSRFVENTPDDCHVQHMSFNTNPWFPEVLEKERQEFLRQVESGARRQAEYDNIWLGKCKPAVDGAIYPDEIQSVIDNGRLCHVPFDPELNVFTIWDLGWNDLMCIGVVQVAAGSVRIIDYIEDSHRTYDSYVSELLAKDYAWKFKMAWLPHDGKARNPQTGKSPIELVNKLGLVADRKGVPDIGVNKGIGAARMMFPRVSFDKANCTPLFNRLRRYARNISPTTETPMAPRKDDNTHGADMFRYIAVIEKQLNNDTQDMEPIDYEGLGLDKGLV